MENSDLKISLDEMRAVFKRQEESFLIGRDIAKSLLVFTTAMLSIMLSITSLKNPLLFENKAFLIIAGIAGVIFVGMIVLSIVLLIPAPILGPVNPKEDVLQGSFVDKDEREVLKQIISDYLSVIQKNAGEIKQRNKIAYVQGALMILVVLCIAAMVVLSTIAIHLPCAS